jgi:hypothetical protein
MAKGRVMSATCPGANTAIFSLIDSREPLRPIRVRRSAHRGIWGVFPVYKNKGGSLGGEKPPAFSVKESGSSLPRAKIPKAASLGSRTRGPNYGRRTPLAFG